jgi:translation initiation factor IF-2
MTEQKSIQLVRAAKELNQGVQVLIDALAAKGHQVENKPSTKLTPEQYNILLKQFSEDKLIREKAEEIHIGQERKEKVEKEKIEAAHTTIIERPKIEGPKIVGKMDLDPKKKEPAPAPSPAPASAPTPAPAPAPAPEVPAPVVKEEPVVPPAPVAEKAPEPVKETPAPKAPEVPVKAEAPVAPAPKAEPVAEKKVEAPQKVAQVAPTVPSPAPSVVKPPVEIATPITASTLVPEKDTVIRAEADKLKGIKVMGKIELPDKRAQEKKSKEKAAAEKKKRKRITGKAVDVTKVQPDVGGAESTDRAAARDKNRKPGAKRDVRPGKSQEPEAISGKEIDDKIKATMAKLGSGTNRKKPVRGRGGRGGGKNDEVELGSTKLQVTEFISVSELANIMNVSPTQVIASCFGLGIMVSINQRIDAELIELVAGEFGFDVEFINITEDDDEVTQDEPEDLLPRAPIVTIMGHVDHGKTSLLDYVRSANIVAGEAGGITQHIGAYEVTLPESGRQITFLDTPGHEAFTAMRARGAKLTDIVVIVVAADDNVMPQTKEAISHAQAAEVPMIIAINKIDKPGANPDNIRQELAGMNVLVEEWGGKYQCQEISAKHGTNVDVLLEKILLQAEFLDLKANPDKLALGSVIEASLDKGRGYVSTIMVQEGTLNIGDFVVAGQYFGKVKALFNERMSRVKKAGPSQPVQLLGLNGAPTAGDKFKVYESEQEAKEIAAKRATIMREQGIRAQKHITLDEIGRRLALGNFKELKLIVKGDVDGSVEALSDSLLKLSTEQIQISIVLKGVGAITENDVLLAAASDAVIVAFQVRPTANARVLAERESIEIRNYSIIYAAIDDVKKAMEGMLEPTFEEKIVGTVEVREVFKISKVGTIAGCFVTDGKIERKSKIRLIRDGIVMFDGELDTLKRFKDDAREVLKGFDCGIKLKNYNDVQLDDIIEVYEQVEVKRKLS